MSLSFCLFSAGRKILCFFRNRNIATGIPADTGDYSNNKPTSDPFALQKPTETRFDPISEGESSLLFTQHKDKLRTIKQKIESTSNLLPLPKNGSILQLAIWTNHTKW